jgi:hypothetical protein
MWYQGRYDVKGTYGRVQQLVLGDGVAVDISRDLSQLLISSSSLVLYLATVVYAHPAMPAAWNAAR